MPLDGDGEIPITRNTASDPGGRIAPMAQFNDQYQTAKELCYLYVHSGWDKSEAWGFADMKNDLDSKRIDKESARLQHEYGLDVATADVHAFLLVQGRFWTVKIPKEFVQPVLDDITGEPAIDPATGRAKTAPHALACKVPPLTEEYLRLLGEPVWIAAFNEVAAHYRDQFPHDDTASGGAETPVPHPSPTPDA